LKSQQSDLFKSCDRY